MSDVHTEAISADYFTSKTPQEKPFDSSEGSSPSDKVPQVHHMDDSSLNFQKEVTLQHNFVLILVGVNILSPELKLNQH